MSYKCIECNKKIDDNDLKYDEKTNTNLIKKKLCFNCNFWIDKISIKNRPDVVILNGVYYMLGNANDKQKGFGGREFNIELNTGEIIITTNLWCCGGIPDIFRERLPNNAKLAKSTRYC